MTHARAQKHSLDDAIHYWADSLVEDGFCIIPDLVTPSMVVMLESDLDPVFANTLFGTGGFYGERTKRFGSLLKRSPRATSFIQHALVLGIVEQVLRPWCDCIQLNLAQAIELHPGALPQYPHRDQDMWQGEKGRIEYLVNVMWPLTPFTKANGATLIRPGSHGRAALEAEADKDRIVAECAPGSALLFLGSTLHAAGGNQTMAVRRGMLISYCLGWLKPYENQWLAYPPPVARHFSPELAALVGYRQHRPNLGNYEGLCPSVLLRDTIPDQIGAIDNLRPDQSETVAGFLAAQRSAFG